MSLVLHHFFGRASFEDHIHVMAEKVGAFLADEDELYGTSTILPMWALDSMRA